MVSSRKNTDKFVRGVSSKHNLPFTAFNSASQFKQISETLVRDIVKSTDDIDLKSESLDFLKTITTIENPKHLGSSEWTSVIYSFSNLLNDCVEKNQLDHERLETAKLGLLSALELGDELSSQEIVNSIEQTVNRIGSVV